jgi:2-polyprenyl-3-methyl-5-hydroxy-6-metoxy-1,4-benzoquinol methylase
MKITKCIGRIEWILSKVVNAKKVLDVGCYGEDIKFDHPLWLHRLISSKAEYTLCIDINPEAEKLRDYGFNVIIGDAQKMYIEEQFDVVVASELIEHLENPGFFLDSVKRVLKPDEFLVITTPNIRSLHNF